LLVTLLSYLPFPFSLPWKDAPVGEALVLPVPYLLGIVLPLIFFVTLLAFCVLTMSQKLSQINQTLMVTQLALAKEQKIATFGALAAAAAHELGSPLSTISLAAKDILSSLSSDSPYLEDTELVISQTNRCRDILLELSQSISQDPNQPQKILPLSALIEFAAQPHKLPHIGLVISKEAPDPEPCFTVTPDLLHGLGNVLQNAFQFATSTVRVTLQWDKNKIEAIIQDDGRGYPLDVLPRLGEPKPSGSKDSTGEASRKGGHMGLGLFIAKTLLSQRQGEVHFSNDGGARCLIKWPSDMKVTNLEMENQDSKT
jgi:two-component system sensor histidine kinase RegB